MDKTQLLATLENLHDELANRERVEPDTLALLLTLTKDIARLVDLPDQPGDADKVPVSLGLKDLLLKFEAQHPQLSARLGEVADALSGMGI